MAANIVAEYVRFSPWLGNHKDFLSCYEIYPNQTTIGIDLKMRDIWSEEISSKRRNIIRHAQKLGVTVGFDYTGEMLDDFLKLYSLTIERNNIGGYYVFSKDYLKRHFCFSLRIMCLLHMRSLMEDALTFLSYFNGAIICTITFQQTIPICFIQTPTAYCCLRRRYMLKGRDANILC